MKSLLEVRDALAAAIANPTRFGFVNARLILRTGIDLDQIKPEHADDPLQVGRATEALADMGFVMPGAPERKER